MDYFIPFLIVIFVLLTGNALWKRNKGPKQYKDVNVADFKALMKHKDAVLIDVRTSKEIAQGKINGALEMNVLDASFRKKIQPMHKEKTYLMYCRSGQRSGKACRIMAQEGFTNLYNLEGGYNAWQAKN